MGQKAEQLKARTAAFARAVIELCRKAEDSLATRTITNQLIASATSVASNYRAACRARSQAEFVAKIGIVREESDESEGWLAMLVDIKAVSASDAQACVKEAFELTAIASAAYRTAKRNLDSDRKRLTKKTTR